MAFRLHEALGTQNERYFVAATPPAHSLACLRIDDPVTAAAARLATGVGGLAPHRTGFAPAGRQTEFHDVIASSLPSDQPCLVAPCNNAAAGAAVVLPGNQPPVPAENRVRRDDAGDLHQNPPAEFLASHRESTALGVGQAKWTWAKLLPEDPILLPEIIDHVFLVAVHPASGREYEEAQSVGHSLRLLEEQPLAPTLFRRFANLGRFVAPYGFQFFGVSLSKRSVLSSSSSSRTQMAPSGPSTMLRILAPIS